MFLRPLRTLQPGRAESHQPVHDPLLGPLDRKMHPSALPHLSVQQHQGVLHGSREDALPRGRDGFHGVEPGGLQHPHHLGQVPEGSCGPSHLGAGTGSPALPELRRGQGLRSEGRSGVLEEGVGGGLGVGQTSQGSVGGGTQQTGAREGIRRGSGGGGRKRGSRRWWRYSGRGRRGEGIVGGGSGGGVGHGRKIAQIQQVHALFQRRGGGRGGRGRRWWRSGFRIRRRRCSAGSGFGSRGPGSGEGPLGRGRRRAAARDAAKEGRGHAFLLGHLAGRPRGGRGCGRAVGLVAVGLGGRIAIGLGGRIAVARAGGGCRGGGYRHGASRCRRGFAPDVGHVAQLQRVGRFRSGSGAVSSVRAVGSAVGGGESAVVHLDLVLGFGGFGVGRDVEFGFAGDGGAQGVIVVGVVFGGGGVGGGAVGQGGLDVSVQEGEAGVGFDVFARRIYGKNLREQMVGRREHSLKLQTALLQIHIATPGKIVDDVGGDGRTRPRLRHQLHDGRHQILFGRRRVPRFLRQRGNFDHNGVQRFFRQIGILSQYPGHGIHQNLGRRGGSVQQIHEHLHRFATNGVLVSFFVVLGPFGDEGHEVVRHVRSDQVSGDVEEGGDRLDVPAVGGSVAFGNLGDASDQIATQVFVRGGAKELQELVGDELYVDGVGHAEEQVQGLALEGLVGVLQTFDHRHLVLGGIFGVVFHNGGEARHADVFQVMVA
mmetsp:Transcript_11656/g.25584  ORF Transcript_11656/g.25584 Transcript_11656/m.25584 type:complete len:709 (-) Transcript_11656:1420-3546(-)